MLINRAPVMWQARTVFSLALSQQPIIPTFTLGLVAERPCTGLQNPLPRFDSGRGLHFPRGTRCDSGQVSDPDTAAI